MSIGELLSKYGMNFVSSLGTTWEITSISFVLGFLLAILLTIVRVSPIKPARVAVDFYVQVFRNIPGLSLLVIMVYALPSLGIRIDYTPSVIVALIIICSAFACENLSTGINTVGVGQVEAARSLGLGFGPIMTNIVIPQALRSVVQPMTSLLIAVMLSSSLASQLPSASNTLKGLDLTGLVSRINNVEVGGILTFVIAAAFYLASSLIIAAIGAAIDKRARFVR